MSERTRRLSCRLPILLLAGLLMTRPGLSADTGKNPPKEAKKPAAEAKEDVKKDVARSPQQAKPKQAPAAVPQVKAEPGMADASKDPDFVFQGEFVGRLPAEGPQDQRIALQIRPSGGGNFEALQYRGGLPGEPSSGKQAISLVGKRWERFLVLSGGPWAVFVEPDHCVLLDRQGTRVGRLQRVLRQSPTLGARPPKDAIVLFDGKDTRQFTTARMTSDGLLMEGADMRPMFQDFNLHLEFMLPYLPAAKEQGRGNSGVYLQSRYEVQILDSFAQEPTYNGCGSLYKFRKPDVNTCFPPLVWQTYDVVFTAPRWAADGVKLRSARVSVWMNGVKVHNNVELADKTGAGKPEEPVLLPIRLQDHHNPVRFRNIWLVDRGAALPVDFPAKAAPAAKPAPKPAPAAKPAGKRSPEPKKP